MALPSGKLSHNYGKSPFFMAKSTISMAMFNSFLYVYQMVSRLGAAAVVSQPPAQWSVVPLVAYNERPPWGVASSWAHRPVVHWNPQWDSGWDVNRTCYLFWGTMGSGIWTYMWL